MKQGQRIAFSYALWIVLIAVAAAVLYGVVRQHGEALPPPLPPVAPPSSLNVPAGDSAVAALRGQVAALTQRVDVLERRGAEQAVRVTALGRRLASLSAELEALGDLAAGRGYPVVVYLHRELAPLRAPLHERLTAAGFRVRMVPDPHAARPFDLDGYPVTDGYGALSALGGEGSVIRFADTASAPARQLARLAGAAGIADLRLHRAASGGPVAIEVVLAPVRFPRD